MHTMKVGLLYPNSNAHPLIGMDFLDGVNVFLRMAGLAPSIQLTCEAVGFGGAEKEVYHKTERLLAVERVDVLIAFVDLKVLPLLQPLLQAAGKPTVVVNAGANYPDNWTAQPNVFYLTLHHAFLCWLSGGSAAQTGNKSAVFASTFYDGGYLHAAAMVNGFLHPGGSVVFNYINRDAYDASFQVPELAAFLAGHVHVTDLLCVFDALPASLLYRALNALPGAGRLRLFASPMMLDGLALCNAGGGFSFSVEGWLPWHPSLMHEANLDFTRSYFHETKKAATAFALLGWETGLILRELLAHGQADGESVGSLLAGSAIAGPRGALTLDGETNYFLSTPVKGRVGKEAFGLEDGLQNTAEEWRAFVSQPAEGVSSGWTNTYLCY